MRTLLLLALAGIGLPALVFAYEPDVTQERMEWDVQAAKDRLVPSGSTRPQTAPLYYLAKFGRYPSFTDAFEWSLILKNGRYLLVSWRLAQEKETQQGPAHSDELTLEVSKELAATIYAIWASGIMDARYTRYADGLDGTTYWFSTYLRGVGWPSARTWSPSADLPPKWLVDAGEAVLELGRSKRANEAPTADKLKLIRGRLDSFRKANSDPDRPNKSLERTRAR
jgi:hypothetical protein